jgi:hypothetical protein
MAGIQQWRSGTHSVAMKSPTAGSRHPAFRALNAVFEDQVNLGWDEFFRGHLSSQWVHAFLQPSNRRNQHTRVNALQQPNIR